MKKPRIEKVTVNIGVGEGGERLRKAEQVLQEITHQKPILTISKTINKDWGIRKGMPIGCKVTLRGEKAIDFLKRALWTRNNKIADWSFDKEGNVSFGISDHTEFEGMKYDPNIGIFGMDICVTMERPGYRIKKRRINRKKVPHRHRMTPEETMEFLKEELNVEVV
ncbi:MAG: 50S ribosomal protein L5 [Thermoplasmata archaeon]|nr:MAG: 50S ribosomal protein L5 [Thermoplasmata archaeon]RLF64195.1 MAG: 50S ribosomal protein L5 [Thermoplasmata archaeon]